VIVVGVVGGGLAIGLALAAILFSQSTFELVRSPAAAAAAEMDAVRARFGGAKPYLDLHATSSGLVGRSNRALEPDAAAPIATVHLVAWRAREERLVRASGPYWALRVGGWKARAMVAVAGVEWEGLDLPDLGRHGPGLIIDHTTPAGDRLLVWAE
jgi:hypothetical protein